MATVLGRGKQTYLHGITSSTHIAFNCKISREFVDLAAILLKSATQNGPSCGASGTSPGLERKRTALNRHTSFTPVCGEREAAGAVRKTGPPGKLRDKGSGNLSNLVVRHGFIDAGTPIDSRVLRSSFRYHFLRVRRHIPPHIRRT